MAGESSRELSIRVHRGIEGIVHKGFRGGTQALVERAERP